MECDQHNADCPSEKGPYRLQQEVQEDIKEIKESKKSEEK